MDTARHDYFPHADRLHVCLITETYHPEVNGVAMTLQRLVNGLIELGHHVSLVRPRQQHYDRPGCCFDPAVTLVPGLPVPGYPGLHLGLPAWRRLYRLWQANRPDVLYVATEGPLGSSALKAAERLHIPVLSGFHTNFHNYTRYYRIGWLQKQVLSVLRRFHNRTAGTLVPNPVLQQKLIAEKFDNVQILSRGVDCNLFTPQRRDAAIRTAWGVSDDDLVLLSVGRLASEKNIELFLRTCRQMQKIRPNIQAVIIGDGPLYKKLKKENPDIIFCGMQRGRTLASYYASADIFVFPSETETFGNVLLEAMASELAVIAYDYAAASMHVRDDENGLSIPLGDERAFVEAATALVAKPERIRAMRKQAREDILGHDWRSITDQFEIFLRNAIGQTVS